jgi:hypothetical protein
MIWDPLHFLAMGMQINNLIFLQDSYIMFTCNAHANVSIIVQNMDGSRAYIYTFYHKELSFYGFFQHPLLI